MRDADFEAFSKELARPLPASGDGEFSRESAARHLYGPGPSYRFLVAQAAWSRGLLRRSLDILEAEPAYKQGFQKYRDSVLEDLAWLHFLRGVNLLMYADRKEVLTQLRLSLELAPASERRLRKRKI